MGSGGWYTTGRCVNSIATGVCWFQCHVECQVGGCAHCLHCKCSRDLGAWRTTGEPVHDQHSQSDAVSHNRRDLHNTDAQDVCENDATFQRSCCSCTASASRRPRPDDIILVIVSDAGAYVQTTPFCIINVLMTIPLTLLLSYSVRLRRLADKQFTAWIRACSLADLAANSEGFQHRRYMRINL